MTRRRQLDRCSLSIPVGMRLLLVSEPESTASTLLRILAGLGRPEAGSFEIAGMADPSHRGWGRRVAYVGSEPGIHEWMTPREALELAVGLLGLPPVEGRRRVDRALEWVGIDQAAATHPVSRGGLPLLQRTGMAAALIGDPEVLLLDEPLRAIEVMTRARILRLPGRRRTILLASRYPASEAGLVSHVALLRRGRVAAVAAVRELEEAGIPLTQRGITSLADRPGSVAGSPPMPLRPAAGQ